MIPRNLRARRKMPQGHKVKKSSEIRRSRSAAMVVGGSRVQTDTGYRVPGFAGKSFETYYEVMLKGTTTPVLMHPKKDRVVRVVAGSIFVVVTPPEGEEYQRRLIAGDEVAIERGTTYRIATAAEQADLFVCQQSKYETSLEVVEEVMAPVAIPSHLLVAPSKQERLMAMRPAEVQTRRGSKAVEQLQAQREGRKSQQIEDKVSTNRSPETARRVAGLNAKPTGGRFDDAGAG